MLPVFPYEVQVRTDLRTGKAEPLEACVASFYQIYHQFTDQKFIYKLHAQTTRNTLLTSQFAQLQLSFTGTRLRYTLLWDEISTALTDDCSHKVAVMSRIDTLINWQARSFMISKKRDCCYLILHCFACPERILLIKYECIN